MTASERPLVLLVEDSPSDVELARRAIAASPCATALAVAEDGHQALELLTGAPGRQPVVPVLVIIDLNLPGMTGLELLAVLRARPASQAVPVAVLSTSVQPSDVQRCYAAGANSYHYKRHDSREYQATIRRIVDYWTSAVAPPRVPGSAPFRLIEALA